MSLKGPFVNRYQRMNGITFVQWLRDFESRFSHPTTTLYRPSYQFIEHHTSSQNCGKSQFYNWSHRLSLQLKEGITAEYLFPKLLEIIVINHLWSACTVYAADCSCYTFHEDGLTWTAARQSCQSNGGDLVSMETPHEWQVVRDYIQNLTNKFNNDWHIGLRRNTTVIGNWTWTWVNGKPLTINHWQPWQPRDGAPYVVMTKNYPPGTRGLFNDIRGDIFAGFICEIPSGVCVALLNIVRPLVSCFALCVCLSVCLTG